MQFFMCNEQVDIYKRYCQLGQQIFWLLLDVEQEGYQIEKFEGGNIFNDDFVKVLLLGIDFKSGSFVEQDILFKVMLGIDGLFVVELVVDEDIYQYYD